jgi:hypothetical protein
LITLKITLISITPSALDNSLKNGILFLDRSKTIGVAKAHLRTLPISVVSLEKVYPPSMRGEVGTGKNGIR